MSNTTISSETLDIEINRDNFPDLLEKLKDLARIGDVIKFKIDEYDILIYSMLGKTSVSALKSYKLKTDDFFMTKTPIEGIVNMIIGESTKFVKNLEFIRTDSKVSLKLSTRSIDECEVRTAQITNGRFKLKFEISESSEIKDISKQQLGKTLRKENRNWAFSLSPDDFKDIKKLSSINSSDSRRVLTLSIEDTKVKLSETHLWELEVDETSESNKHIIFNKTFLSYINETGKSIEFNVFENFIFIEDENSNLMISFEQDFE